MKGPGTITSIGGLWRLQQQQLTKCSGYCERFFSQLLSANSPLHTYIDLLRDKCHNRLLLSIEQLSSEGQIGLQVPNMLHNKKKTHEILRTGEDEPCLL